MSLLRAADSLRQTALLLGQGSLRAEAVKPGVNEALRVSIQYHDGRTPDSVATLRRGHGATCILTVVYSKVASDQSWYAYTFSVLLERYQKLLAALRLAQFDRRDDAENLPSHGADLWLIERAAGTFFHDVVLAPALATGHHREFVMALRAHLPEAVRELAL